MKWERARRSSNVDDRRGGGGGRAVRGAGGLGIGGILLVLAISWFTGQNPAELLRLVETAPVAQAPQEAAPGGAPTDAKGDFIAAILGETEDVWSAIYQQNGGRYAPPTLVLFEDTVQSACGLGEAATGPFYCPADRKVYLELGFFEQMRTRLGGGGEFAEAYVIAHEVGHHIQTLTGVSRQVQELRRRGEDVKGANGPLVRQELQADCYAGVWAHHAQQRHDWLEPGDIERALSTAAAIGDDRLQRQARGVVVPDSFSHGTSEQRVRWFRTGFESGDPARCDTFAATRL